MLTVRSSTSTLQGTFAISYNLFVIKYCIDTADFKTLYFVHNASGTKEWVEHWIRLRTSRGWDSHATSYFKQTRISVFTSSHSLMQRLNKHNIMHAGAGVCMFTVIKAGDLGLQLFTESQIAAGDPRHATASESMMLTVKICPLAVPYLFRFWTRRCLLLQTCN